METNHILIVEDDKEIREGIQIYLQSQGYDVFQAADGVEGLEIIEREEIHLAIVDIMMPRMDGIRMTMKLREKYDFPVIMLSAKSEEVDKITGLNIGADDYVTKPFYMGELLARIRAALRKAEKSSTGPGSTFEDGDLLVDYEKRRVEVAGQEVHLTPIEYKILCLLIANRGKVLTHHYMLKEIWGYAEGVEAGTLRVFMATLRRKIEKNPSEPEHIVTEVGVGYRFK